MKNKVIIQPAPYILRGSLQKAYAKIKALILKIFSLLKGNKEQKNLKEEFYDSYIGFARKLDEVGFKDESNYYMDICAMYHDLMGSPNELIAHENFFIDLFDAFEELLFARVNNQDDYALKSEEFLMYSGKMQEYYYTEVAIPSPHYDEKTCMQIIGKLAGDLNE